MSELSFEVGYDTAVFLIGLFSVWIKNFFQDFIRFTEFGVDRQTFPLVVDHLVFVSIDRDIETSDLVSSDTDLNDRDIIYDARFFQ